MSGAYYLIDPQLVFARSECTRLSQHAQALTIELTSLRAENERLQKAIEAALAECPYCDGTGLAAIAENDITWDEPCVRCRGLREALAAEQ